jgi:hypothetical protein
MPEETVFSNLKMLVNPSARNEAMRGSVELVAKIANRSRGLFG